MKTGKRWILRQAVALLAAAGLALTAGCTEGEALLTVKKDGSGTLFFRLLMTRDARNRLSDVMEVLEQMDLVEKDTPAGALQELSRQGGGDPMKALLNVDQLKAYGAALGEGVRFQQARKITRGTTEEGVEVTYAFADVRKLRIAAGPAPGQGGKARVDTLTFDFVPMKEPVLKLLPPLPSVAPRGAAGGEGNMLSSMPGASTALESLFAGVRLTARLEVEGDIMRGNASYPLTKRSALLGEVITDQMNGEDLPALLQLRAWSGLKALKTRRAPGLRLEEPDRVLIIQFQ